MPSGHAVAVCGEEYPGYMAGCGEAVSGHTAVRYGEECPGYMAERDEVRPGHMAGCGDESSGHILGCGEDVIARRAYRLLTGHIVPGRQSHNI